MQTNAQENWPRIRKRKTKVKGHNYSYWILDGGVVDGHRVYRNFKIKKEALLAANKLRIERNKIGADALRLNDDQKKDAIAAFNILQEQSTLTEAAKCFIKHRGLKASKKSVNEVIQEYLAEAREYNLRPRSINDLIIRLKRFSNQFGGSNISEISRHNINDWHRNLRKLDDSELSLVSKRHYLTVVGGLFNFAIEREYISENPVLTKIRRRRRTNGCMDEHLPGILSFAEVERVMFAAQDNVPSMVPALAIGFFAGLRTAEIQQLDWKHVDFESRLITVSPEIAKKRSVRHVTMESNLIAWLLPFRKISGLIALQGTAWRYQFDKVRKSAEVDKWPDNAMRHTFASNHLTQYQNQNKTALELGHRDTDLLYKHYRALVKPDDAKRYWLIQPKKEGNIIQFRQAATS